MSICSYVRILRPAHLASEHYGPLGDQPFRHLANMQSCERALEFSSSPGLSMYLPPSTSRMSLSFVHCTDQEQPFFSTFR
ncbi:hypothetical protein POVWA2_017900 [Plasmodium ovale wallikeri]|uniref:Uncharacterized protein n=1 Tax=Plasmodium ovale wallikeri TaxID=864142 RepID=A0A1A8YQ56_PLAOA|nr:hypothetical protein POVWA1_018010 [Plasmodium ovale wallikeri]SBT34046.1 hypothetical protein POVWA2_017900 [Plasmodium ovale wallikeri]